jgi:oligopeptide transport system permease protein
MTNWRAHKIAAASGGYKNFFAHRGAVCGLAMLVLLIGAALCAPLLPSAFDEIFWDHIKAPPQWEGLHWFGFDVNGRDLLARTLLGMRVSLQVALIATAVSVVVGVAWGAIAGYCGGRIDEAMMRVVDILYALPYILFVILLMVIFGRREILLYLGIGLLEWITMARIVRGQTLSLKEREFIDAARAAGASTAAIIFRHIVPNLAGPVAVYATLTIPEIMLTESFLSYLGFGVQEPRTSLGTLISEGADKLGAYPWMLLFPGAALIAVLSALLLVGDGLRDALDVRGRSR